MNEKSMTTLSRDDPKIGAGKTDWKSLRQKKATSISDADNFEIDWTSAHVVSPPTKTHISLRVDADVLDFFKRDGKGYQTRINAVLRTFMKAHQG